MRSHLPFLFIVVLSVLLSSAARSDITLTGNAYVASDGDLKYISDDSLIWADDGTGSGAVNDPYVYKLGSQNLDLAGYYIRGAINDTSDQRSARYELDGSVLGNGSFYSAPNMGQNNRDGGTVRIYANGSISVANVWTGFSYQNNSDTISSGHIVLIATNGPVHVSGYLSTEAEGPAWSGDKRSGNVVLRSEGDGRGITITGTDGSGYSIRTHGYVDYAGDVKLETQGDIELAGGIYTTQEGDVTIQGDSAGTTRAGAVAIGGTIYTRTSETYRRCGNILVNAASLYVDGSLRANQEDGAQTQGGNVDIDVTDDCEIEGYIMAGSANDNHRSVPGHVIITAHHIFVNGKNYLGESITTDSAYSGDFDDSRDEQYDGDIRLTATSPVTAKFAPENPLLGETSSITIAGKISTERDSDQVTGHVILKAVELHLGDDIETETGSSIAIHYGQEDYGVVTHLMENEVYWDGVAAHNISYINGTTTFTDDMPYGGILRPPGTVILFR
jgi:hypothetical protein